jgi:hypothetical protein
VPAPGDWPATPPAPGRQAVSESPVRRPVLPTRTRQASLARELRDQPAAPENGAGTRLDAEEMRAVFGAFQRGLDRGRKGLPVSGQAQADATAQGPGISGPTDATARDPGARRPTERRLPPAGAGDGATRARPSAPGRGPGSAQQPAPAHNALADPDPEPLTSHPDEGTDADHER